MYRTLRARRRAQRGGLSIPMTAGVYTVGTAPAPLRPCAGGDGERRGPHRPRAGRYRRGLPPGVGRAAGRSSRRNRYALSTTRAPAASATAYRPPW